MLTAIPRANRTDDNNNYYPHAFTRNTTNSPSHVDRIFQDPRYAQFQRVPFSAFFETYPRDISVFNPWKRIFQNEILPLLKHRATLPIDSATTSQNTEIVFVYDVEDLTLLSTDHLAAMETMFPHIQSRTLHYVPEFVLYASKIQKLFVGRQFPEIVDNIEEVFNGQTDEIKNIVPKYTTLKYIYSKVSRSFKRKNSIISEDLLYTCSVDIMEKSNVVCEIAEKLQKVYNQRWKTVDKCLKLVKRKSENSTKNYANVVLSRPGVAYGASNILVSGHAPFIPIENIYSTKNLSRQKVLERIQSRFGEKCTLIYVTSFRERAQLPEKLNIPMWPLFANDSFKLLYKVQRDYLLRERVHY